MHYYVRVISTAKVPLNCHHSAREVLFFVPESKITLLLHLRAGHDKYYVT